jgi:hypothetical protein
MVFATLVMAAAIAVLQYTLAPWLTGTSHLWRLIALGLLIAVGLGVYSLLLHLLGVAQLRDLVKAMRRSG